MKKHNKGHTLSLCSLGNTAPHNECWLYCNMRAMNRDVSVGSISSLRVYCQPRTNRADTVDAHGANGEYDRCRRCLPDGQIVHLSVQPCSKKYSRSLFTQITSTSIAIPAPIRRGVSRSSRTSGWDAMDAGARLTSVLSCGRRSRVVLTPRRWCQASQKCLRGDGDNKARSPGRVRRKPLKPLRREGRVNRRDRGD